MLHHMLGACSELWNEKSHCQTADLNIPHTKNAFLFYVLGILWRAESQRDFTWTTVRLSICLSICTMLSQLCKLWWHYGPKQWRTVQLVWPVLYKQFQICTQLQLAMWAYCIFRKNKNNFKKTGHFYSVGCVWLRNIFLFSSSHITLCCTS